MTGVVVVCPGIEDRLSTAAAKTSKSDWDMNFTCELDATWGSKATTYLISTNRGKVKSVAKAGRANRTYRDLAGALITGEAQKHKTSGQSKQPFLVMDGTFRYLLRLGVSMRWCTRRQRQRRN
jgi:hypothetical protein